MTDSSPLFELTTAVAPPRVFTVDDEEYQLLDTEHFTKVQEVHSQALFSRYLTIARKMISTSGRSELEKLAGFMYELRMEILETHTTVPRDVLEKLSVSSQLKLLESIQGTDENEDEVDADEERL